MRFAWLVLGCSTACTSASLFDMTVTSEPVAVGAHALGSLQSRTCSGSSCDFHDATIVSMAVSPPGVFDAPQADPEIPGRFAIRAIGEGTATFTITGDDGENTRTFTREINAVAANRVTGAWARQGVGCTEPFLFTPTVLALMPFEVWRDDAALFNFGFTPFVVAGPATIDPSVSFAGSLGLRLPATPATITVTSTLDASFGSTVQVIDPMTVDGIQLSPPDEPLRILDETTMRVDILAGGTVICDDYLTRRATTLTPEVCKIVGAGPQIEVVKPGMREVDVTGHKAGTCTIQVTHSTSTITATMSFEVTM